MAGWKYQYYLIIALAFTIISSSYTVHIAAEFHLKNLFNKILPTLPNLACLEVFTDHQFYNNLHHFIPLNKVPIVVHSFAGYDLNGTNVSKAFCSTHLILSVNQTALSYFLNNTVSSFQRGKLIIVTGAQNTVLRTLLLLPPIRNFLNLLIIQIQNRHFFTLYTHRAPVSPAPKWINSFRNGSLIFPGLDFFPDKLSNLHEYELKTTSFTYPPNCVRSTNADGSYEYHGVEISIMETLARALNFTFVVTEPPGSELWGEKLSNGTYTGLLKKMVMRESDVGFAGLYIQPARMEIMDFTSAYKIIYECFAVPAPQPLPQWTALYLPFGADVWLATLTATCLAGVTLYTIAKLSAGRRDADHLFLKMSTVVFYVYSNIIQAPVEIEVRSRTVRLFIIWWFIIATIVPTVYKSALTAYITIPINPPSINTLKELSQTSIAKGGFGDTTLNLLKASKDPVLQKLSEQVVPYYNMTWGYEKLSARELALTSMEDNLQYLIRTSFSTKAGEPIIHTVQQCLVPFRVGLALQKNSIYTAKFSSVVQRIVESGLVDYWLKDFIRKTPQDFKYIRVNEVAVPSTSTGQLAPFKLANLQGAFLLLVFGYGIAFFTCILENFSVRKHSNRRINTLM